jgi:hypothetical protein
MTPEEQYTDYQSKLYNSMVDHSIDGLGIRTTSTTEGLWSQIVNSNTYKTPAYLLEERLNKIELDNKLLKLKVLGLEGKFTQEEITNIRKMLMSEDEASKTLADSIIENA